MRALNLIIEFTFAFRKLQDDLVITDGCVSIEECSDHLNLLADTKFVRRHANLHVEERATEQSL